MATTALKFLPLLAVIPLAALVLGREGTAVLPPLQPEHLRLTGSTGITAAAALTLCSFLGLESATIPAEKWKILAGSSFVRLWRAPPSPAPSTSSPVRPWP